LEFNDFVNKCLTLEPSERPSAEVLLQHPFIKKSKGKKFLEELVMNWIDRIEADREERALKLKQSKNDEGFFGGRRENKGIILDKVDLNYLSQEEDDSSYGKSDKKYTTNESGTMIVRKTPENSSGKNSGIEDVSQSNTGSIVYHETAEDGSNEFEVYMKMLKEFNQKYEGDRLEMENDVAEICRHLSYNQRVTPLDTFTSKRDALKNEMDNEILRIKQRYGEKISSINKIVENKKKLELLRIKFKEIGENIEDMECMKDIGDKSKFFRRDGTFDSKEGSAGPQRQEPKEASVLAGANSASNQYIKKIYKIGEKARVPGGGNGISTETEPVASILSNISKLKKMNSNEKNILSSRAALNKTPSSPSNHTPKGASQLEKKNQLSSKNLLSKKPLVTYLAEKGKGHQSSADKISNKPKK
jgi:hypothetical protein